MKTRYTDDLIAELRAMQEKVYQLQYEIVKDNKAFASLTHPAFQKLNRVRSDLQESIVELKKTMS